MLLRALLPKTKYGHRFLLSSSHNAPAASTGLFGLESLNSPKDFVVVANAAIARCNDVRSELKVRLSQGKAAQTSTLLLLDSISNEVCTVIDVAELCRNVHADQGYRDAAEDAYAKLSSYLHELNSDTTLYTGIDINACTHTQFHTTNGTHTQT